MACKQVGGYEPILVDAYIGEQLNGQENETCFGFLTWVQEGLDANPEQRREFGSGNIRERFAEYVKSS